MKRNTDEASKIHWSLTAGRKLLRRSYVFSETKSTFKNCFLGEEVECKRSLDVRNEEKGIVKDDSAENKLVEDFTLGRYEVRGSLLEGWNEKSLYYMESFRLKQHSMRETLLTADGKNYNMWPA